MTHALRNYAYANKWLRKVEITRQNYMNLCVWLSTCCKHNMWEPADSFFVCLQSQQIVIWFSYCLRSLFYMKFDTPQRHLFGDKIPDLNINMQLGYKSVNRTCQMSHLNSTSNLICKFFILKILSHLLIKASQYFLLPDKNMDITLQAIENTSKLQSNISTSHYCNLLRSGRQIQCCIRINDMLYSWDVWLGRAATNSYKYVFGSVKLAVHTDSMWVNNLHNLNRFCINFHTKDEWIISTEVMHTNFIWLKTLPNLSTAFNYSNTRFFQCICLNSDKSLQLQILIGYQSSPVMLWISLIHPSKATAPFELMRILGCIHQQFLWNTATKHTSEIQINKHLTWKVSHQNE